jgi:hypothetical protein
MIVSAYRRALILSALYIAILAGWLAFARWVSAPVIAAAVPGRWLELFGRLARDIGRAVPHASALDRWHYFTWAVFLAGLLHFALVLLIYHDDPASPAGKEPTSPRQCRLAKAALVVLALAFLGLTVLRGDIQDYYFYIQMWREVQLGHDPWFFAQGVFGTYPMNAYGPLFNAFAIPELVNPLLPKLLFAAAYLAFAIFLVKSVDQARPDGEWSWVLRIAWLWMPYCWIELANFGHFDVLVGLLCVAAVQARLRRRDIISGACLGLGVLLKFMPVVLLPFLILDRPRPRYRLLGAAAATIVVGLGASVLLWGPSTFRPLIFAAGRSSHHLSIYRVLKGHYSPLRWLDIRDGLEELAPAFILAGLARASLWVRKYKIDPAASSVIAILLTLMFYQVGFAQYYMVLFVLASYWLLCSRSAITDTISVWIPLGCYFGWLSIFDLMLVFLEIDSLGMQEWIGLPTFLLGCWLLASTVRFVGRDSRPG